MTNIKKYNHSLFDFDLNFSSKNNILIGTDEAGRGPGAGPVCAAAVSFKEINNNLINELKNLNDSKKLTEKKREDLFKKIIENSYYAIKFASVEEIEKMNILKASLFAMQQACEEVAKNFEKDLIILVDGSQKIPNLKYSQEKIIKGDATSASIAAASILAKVSRDNLMKELDKKFPQYNWQKNKGYLTKEHLEAIKNYGVTKHHRKKFLRNIEVKQLSLIN